MPNIRIVRFEREVSKNELAFPARGINTRNPAAGTVSRSGHTTLNAAAADAFREVIRLSKYTGDSVAVTSAVDAESGTVLLYVVDPSALGSIVCGFPKHRNSASLHLHSIFAQYPDLAVTQPMSCPVTVGQDNTDAYCLAITLKGVRPAGRKSRNSGAIIADPAQA